MKMKFFAFAIFTLASLPVVSYAQGTIPGAEERPAGGKAAGPSGAAVGRGVGAAAGTVGEERPGFREYVVHERHPSFQFGEELRVGAVLPARGVTLYEAAREYGVGPGYWYAVVNHVPVIVEPRSRRIVEIIE